MMFPDVYAFCFAMMKLWHQSRCGSAGQLWEVYRSEGEERWEPSVLSELYTALCSTIYHFSDFSLLNHHNWRQKLTAQPLWVCLWCVVCQLTAIGCAVPTSVSATAANGHTASVAPATCWRTRLDASVSSPFIRWERVDGKWALGWLRVEST